VKSSQLLTVNAAAERLGLKHSAVRRAISRGELPAMRVCSRIRVDSGELDRWLEAQRIKPPSQP
jgi:excisionase family DNA binding protein